VNNKPESSRHEPSDMPGVSWRPMEDGWRLNLVTDDCLIQLSLDKLIRRPQHHRARIIWTIGPVTETSLMTGGMIPQTTLLALEQPQIHKEPMMANNTLVMNDLQSAVLSIGSADARGNVSALPTGDVPVWTVTDATIIAVAVNADGMTATVSAVGPLGTATANVVATLADGSQATGGLDVTITASNATVISITAAAPTP